MLHIWIPLAPTLTLHPNTTAITFNNGGKKLVNKNLEWILYIMANVPELILNSMYFKKQEQVDQFEYKVLGYPLLGKNIQGQGHGWIIVEGHHGWDFRSRSSCMSNDLKLKKMDSFQMFHFLSKFNVQHTF